MVTFLGEVGTAIRLNIKSCFADMVLSTSDSFFGSVVFFSLIPPRWESSSRGRGFLKRSTLPSCHLHHSGISFLRDPIIVKSWLMPGNFWQARKGVITRIIDPNHHEEVGPLCVLEIWKDQYRLPWCSSQSLIDFYREE